MARRGRAGGLLRPSLLIGSTSISKGLFGDSRFWRAVFFLVTARKVLRRITGSEPDTIAVETLKPGQSVSIEAIDPRPRESRRKQRRRRPK